MIGSAVTPNRTHRPADNPLRGQVGTLNLRRRGERHRPRPGSEPGDGDTLRSGQQPEYDLSNLKNTATKGVAWSWLKAVSSPVIGTAVIVVMAWRLSPADFGTVALAMVFIALISMVVESGLGMAIIQRKVVTQTDLNSAFWLNIAISVTLALAVIISADLLGKTLGQPHLAPVLRMLSLVFVFAALGSVPQAILRRRLAFARVALCHLGATLTGATVGVTLAITGAGLWSLVGQAVVWAGMDSALLWAACPWRPGGPVSAASIKDLLHFSSHIVGGQLASFASRYSDDFLIGVVLGPVALGIYTIAYRIVLALRETIVWTLEDVTFPLLSRLGDDPQRRERALFGMTSLSITVAVPIFLAVAVLAPEMIRLAFGPRWADAIPVMQTLALVGIANCAVSCNKAALNAAGRPDITLYIGIFNAVLNVVGFAVTVQWGILAVAMSYAICSYLIAPVYIWLVIRELSLNAVAYLRLFVAPIVSGLVMVACVLGARAALADETSDVAKLLLSLFIAFTTYTATLYLTGRRQALDLVSAVVRLRAKTV